MRKNTPTTVTDRQEVSAVARQLVATTDRGKKAIADRLAQVRREKGVTQVQMANKLKTSQSMYSRYESGELRIHAELLIAMAKALGVTPNDVLGITDGGHVAAEPIEHSIPKRVLRRLKDVDQLSRTDQDTLLSTIDALIAAGKNKRQQRATKKVSKASA